MSSCVPAGQEGRREEGDVMRRLILQTDISIDGYVAALDKSHPWGVEREEEEIKRGLPSRLHLELVEAMTYPSGVAIHIYRPRSRPSDQSVD
jgi:hypothetical protein